MHVLRRDGDKALGRAFNFTVDERRERGHQTVEKATGKQIRLKKVVTSRVRMRNAVYELPGNMR